MHAAKSPHRRLAAGRRNSVSARSTKGAFRKRIRGNTKPLYGVQVIALDIYICKVSFTVSLHEIFRRLGMSDQVLRKPPGDGDSDYDSAEDADFQDSDDALSHGSSEDEAEPQLVKRGKDQELDSGDEATIAKQAKKKRKSATTDDLILTRAQKRAK